MAKALTLYSASSLLVLSLLGCNSGHDPKAVSSANAQKIIDSQIASIELSNPSNFARKQQPLYLSFYDLGLRADDSRAQDLAVKVEGSYVPSNLIDRDGDGQDDSLFALIDMSAGETVDITVEVNGDAKVESTKLTQAEISKKVGGHWQPRKENPELQEYVGGEFKNVYSLTPPPQHTDHSGYIRYEGPGIESDKVGYRIYLDERNGFDIFGKTTHDMVLQDVGQDGFGSYHEMSDWGMDILKVGNSLGAGSYGYWTGDAVQLVSDLEGWDAHIIENGDLYSAIQIVYKDWRVADKTLNLTANLSMHGGSRLVHTRLALSEPLPNMAIGLVKHPGTEFIQGDMNITGKAYTYIASWGTQTLNDDKLGMALLFRKGDNVKVTSDESNYVAVMDASGQDLDYYFLAAWETELDGIKTKEEFIAYLEQQAEKLTLEPRKRLKTALSQEAKQQPVSADSALDWAKKLADSELERKVLDYRFGGWDANREREPKFEYDIVGLLPLAYDELAKVAPQPEYQQVMNKVTGSFITEDGDIRRYSLDSYNIDSVAPGRNVLRLYEQTGEEKYKIAAGHIREQLGTSSAHIRRRFLTQEKIRMAGLARRRIHGHAIPDALLANVRRRREL